MTKPLFRATLPGEKRTGSPISLADAIAYATDPTKDLRWDPGDPMSPGYDPVPVQIHSITNDVALISVLDANTGKPSKERFSIKLMDRDECHEGIPSTPRPKVWDPAKPVVILMVGANYHQSAKAVDDSKTFKLVAEECSVELAEFGKWPQTEAAADTSIVGQIIEACMAGTPITMDFIRDLYRERLKVAPNLHLPRPLTL